MKTMMKSLIVVLLLIASGAVVMAADNAPIQDEPLPPEVRKLIGMKIPPKVVGREPAHIPNFSLFGGSLLNWQIGYATPKADLAYEEGMLYEKWPVFFVIAFHSDKTLEILDARLLPGKLLNWRYKNGKIKRLEDGDFFIFSGHCYYDDNDPSTNNRIVFGLEDPKFEHDGYTTRIERAWEIDQQTGRIKSISATGIACAVLGE
jgi:hypothetical protein